MEIGEFVELVEGETPTLNSFKGRKKWFGKPVKSYVIYFEDSMLEDDNDGEEVELFGINVRTKSTECMLNFVTSASQIQDGNALLLDKNSIAKLNLIMSQDYNVSKTEIAKLSVRDYMALIMFVVKISTPY